MNPIAVITTVDNNDNAKKIANELVRRRLAACVQISSIDSVYEWDGDLQNDREYRLLAKTTRRLYAQVEAAIVELHDYELPAIFAIDMAEAYEPFSEWVAEQCGPIRGH